MDGHGSIMTQFTGIESPDHELVGLLYLCNGPGPKASLGPWALCNRVVIN